MAQKWVVKNGQKIFCTNAGKAGIIIITAKIIDKNSSENNIGALHVLLFHVSAYISG